MPVILWIIVALGLGLLAVVFATRQALSIAPLPPLPPGEAAPTAPMQRVVRWSLGIGLVPVAMAAGVIAWIGPMSYEDDDGTRLLVTGLLLLGLFVLVIPTFLASIWSARNDRRLDERDRAILARAPTSQAPAMLVVLAAWMIALQESFRGDSGVPGIFLNLLFWSCVLVALAASNVAVLVGYRRG